MPVHDCLRVSPLFFPLTEGSRNSENSISFATARTQLSRNSKSPLQVSRRPHALQVHSSLSPLTCSEFSPGKIAIMSRSGTLCYETVASTTKAKLGQSTVIGIGGDRLPGTTYVDALQMLAEDSTTQGSFPLDNAKIRDNIDWWSGRKGRIQGPWIYQANKFGSEKVVPIIWLQGLTVDLYWPILPGYVRWKILHSVMLVHELESWQTKWRCDQGQAWS